MSFQADLTRYANRANASVEDAAIAIKLQLFQAVILDTRVDTGRLRGNWQTSNNAPILRQVNRLDKEGVKAISEARQKIKPFTVDYLSNNLEYAAVWEERDGMIAKALTAVVARLS